MPQFAAEGPGVFPRPRGHCQGQMKWTVILLWHAESALVTALFLPPLASVTPTVSTGPNLYRCKFSEASTTGGYGRNENSLEVLQVQSPHKNPYLQECREVQRLQWLTQGDSRGVSGGPLSEPCLSVRWLNMHKCLPSKGSSCYQPGLFQKGWVGRYHVFSCWEECTQRSMFTVHLKLIQCCMLTNCD